jgi:hypothetical protein
MKKNVIKILLLSGSLFAMQENTTDFEIEKEESITHDEVQLWFGLVAKNNAKIFESIGLLSDDLNELKPRLKIDSFAASAATIGKIRKYHMKFNNFLINHLKSELEIIETNQKQENLHHENEKQMYQLFLESYKEIAKRMSTMESLSNICQGLYFEHSPIKKMYKQLAIFKKSMNDFDNFLMHEFYYRINLTQNEERNENVTPADGEDSAKKYAGENFYALQKAMDHRLSMINDGLYAFRKYARQTENKKLKKLVTKMENWTWKMDCQLSRLKQNADNDLIASDTE